MVILSACKCIAIFKAVRLPSFMLRLYLFRVRRHSSIARFNFKASSKLICRFSTLVSGVISSLCGLIFAIPHDPKLASFFSGIIFLHLYKRLNMYVRSAGLTDLLINFTASYRTIYSACRRGRPSSRRRGSSARCPQAPTTSPPSYSP